MTDEAKKAPKGLISRDTRPDYASTNYGLACQVGDYHMALREAREILFDLRERCRQLLHPLSTSSDSIVCPWCRRISEELGEA